MGNSGSRRQEELRQRRLEDTGLTPQQLHYLRNSKSSKNTLCCGYRCVGVGIVCSTDSVQCE